MAKNPNKDIERKAHETAAVVEDALRSIGAKIGSIFEDALNEGQDVTASMVKDIQGSLNSLNKVSQTIASSMEKAASGAFRLADANKIIQERMVKIKALKIQIAIAGTSDLKAHKQLTKEMDTLVGYNEELTDELKAQVGYSKNINKAMGLTGGIMKSLGNISKKLGLDGLDDTFTDATSEASKLAAELTKGGENAATMGQKFRVMGKALSTLGKGLAEALSDPLVILGLMVKAVKFLVGMVDHHVKAVRDAGKAYGVAGKNAEHLHHVFMEMGDAGGDMFYFTEEMLANTIEMNKAMGMSLAPNKENAKTFQDLSMYVGLGAEQAGQLFKLSVQMDKPFGDMYDSTVKMVNEMDKASGVTSNMDDIMKVITESSATTRRNFAGNYQAMVRTAHAANRLGTTMEEIRDASRQTLDFESSIAKEIEAEQFLQKDINLDKLRYATLTRDDVGMQEERERLIRETMDETQHSQFALEKTAALLGISTEEYEKQAAALRDGKKLRSEMSPMEKDSAEEMKQMGEDAATFDRSMMAAVKQLKAMLEPIVKTLAPAITSIIKGLGNFFGSFAGKALIALAGVVAGGVLLVKAHSTFKSIFSKGLMGAFAKKGTYLNPMIVRDISGGGGGSDMMNMASNLLGKRGLKVGNFFKKASKWFSASSKTGKQWKIAKVMEKGLRNMSAMSYKRSSYVNQIVKNNATLSKMFPAFAKLTSKVSGGTGVGSSYQAMTGAKFYKGGQFMPGGMRAPAGGMNMGPTAVKTQAKTATMMSKFTKGMPAITKTFSKVGPILKTVGKVLGPVAVIADVAIGGYTGYNQAQMSAGEQKAAGVKQGISTGAATTLGFLTGGAEKGSMMSSWVGVEKGSGGDEAMGVGGSALRGAAIGATIGAFGGPIGMAIGGAIGGLIGAGAEVFKLASDPDSKFRKGLAVAGEAIGDFASAAGETISNWASETWSGMKKGASALWEGTKAVSSSMWEGAKSMGSSAWKGVKSMGSTAWGGVKDAGSAVAGFFGFADGGIASGPSSGYPAMLHGTEAVIPLPSGGGIPVQMSGGGGNTDALLKQLIGAVRAGGNIYMDSAKVGQQVAQSASSIGA